MSDWTEEEVLRQIEDLRNDLKFMVEKDPALMEKVERVREIEEMMEYYENILETFE